MCVSFDGGRSFASIMKMKFPSTYFHFVSCFGSKTKVDREKGRTKNTPLIVADEFPIPSTSASKTLLWRSVAPDTATLTYFTSPARTKRSHGKEIRSHRIIPSAPVDYLRDIDKVNYNTASSWPTYKVWCREFSSTLHEPRTMDRDGSIAAIKLLKSGKRRWKGSRKKYHCLAWANETFNVRCNKACDQKCFNRRKPLCLALF